MTSLLTLARIIRALAGAALLLALAALAFSLMDRPGHIGVLGLVQREGDGITQLVDARSKLLIVLLNNQATALSEQTAQELHTQLTLANESIAKVAKLRDDVQPVLADLKNVTDVASENADLLGRCEENPDCLANRAIPAMKSFEKMSAAGEKMAVAIEKETPATAAAIRQSSQDTATIVHRLTKPVSWIRGAIETIGKVAFKILF